MAEQGEDPEGVYVEHQYMCSECHQLFSTLEDVLIHQQIHTGVEGDAESVTIQDMSEMMGAEGQQYQCLECGALLLNPEELLQHQEMHMREAGMEVEHQELCEVLETEGGGGSEAVPVQYQCLDCLALFDSPDVWLEHRQTHSHSSTHSSTATETMEYVLQPDGTITPLNSVQNYILSEQQAGEILAQVLAQQQQQQRQQQLRQQQQQQQQQKRKLQQQQRKRQSVPKIAAKPPRSTLLPPVSASPGSATMHLQILTAQALADSSTTPRLQHAKLMPALLGSTAKLGILENGLQRVELRLAPGVQEIKMEHHQQHHLQQPQLKTEVMVIHPYECSECSLLFQTPEDFLQHQGVHFLGQDKESGDASGVMTGDEEERGIREDAAVKAAEEPRQPRQAEEKKAWCQRQQCDICKRTFTSVNRLAAHKRVHEQGTHECPECGKMFKKATTLQTHMRTHSGVARYLCVDCGHGFNTEMTLITHRKSHTADPLHKCLFCAKTFTNMTKFLYHRRTHIDRSGSTTAPVTMVPAHSKASPSTLAILQRARERREASRAQQEAMSTLLAPLTDVEMENMPVDTSAQGSQKASDEGEEERRGEKSSKDVATPSPVADSGPPQVEETSEMDVDEKSASTEDVSAGAPSVSSDPAGAAPAGLPPDKGPFPCRSCTKSFQSHLQLLHHRRKSHTVERSFHCGVCGKSFKKQIHVRNHLRTHTGERPFQCSDCGKTFSSHANLVRHNLTHSGVRPYHCKVCDRTFSQSSNLRQHSLLHSNAAKLSCPDCPATFRWPSKLATHRYTQHPGAPPPFPCSHCDAGFLTRRQLETHCLDLHTAPVLVAAGGEVGTGHPLAQGVLGGDPSTSEPSTSTAGEGESGASGVALVRGGLDCNICGKKLNSVANMRLHRLSHLAAGPGRPRGSTLVKRPRPKAHQCPVCGKLFVSASGLALHMRVHTGERPFPCTVCGKRFRQNTHLREHLRTHSGERPFCCEVCGKGFIQSMHLSEHRRTHTGERPHSCPLPQCGKTFKTFSNLRNHKKTHARQQRREEEAAARETAVALVDASAVELANGQTQVIHIQTTSLPQTQGTPTIMCNEFGETIAIIETSEGGELPLEQALEIYHRALENGLTMETVAVEGMQLL